MPAQRKILGLSVFYHDSAAAMVIDGKFIAAAQEERFTRKKTTPIFRPTPFNFAFALPEFPNPIWTPSFFTTNRF
jgi:predicted NodU family carbamoyl transferase